MKKILLLLTLLTANISFAAGTLDPVTANNQGFDQERWKKLMVLIDSEINSLLKYADKLKVQKKGLMQRLLSGQVRVKV